MEYYVAINGQSRGPMDVEEIKKLPGFTANTLVWRDGMDDWVKASTIDEFAEYFRSILKQQPPIPPQQPQQPQQNPQQPQQQYQQPQQQYQQPDNRPPMPETYLVWNILCTIFCCIVFGVIGIVYSSQVSSAYNRGDYQGAEAASKQAKTWMITAICVGGAIVLFYLIWAACAAEAVFSFWGL